MFHQLSKPTLVLAMLTAGACFDPMVDPGPGGGDGTGSDGSTTEPEASGGTTDPDSTSTTDAQADRTGNSDAPPVITAFTVNGSTMPEEQQTAGMVAFDVDAMDDVGIDRIEIYDGDELVATVSESPYVTEILVSSADNGSHAYSAVVFDIVGQSAESEVVPLSVNVIGGAILELRTDIAEATMPLYFGLPRVAVDDAGDVFVTLTSPPDALDRTHVQALSYSPTLSLLWESTLDPFGTSAAALAHPIITAGGELLVGGFHSLVGSDESTMTLYRANADTGEPSNPVMFGSTGGHLVYPITVQLLDDDIVLATQPNVLESFSADFTSASWSQEQFPAFPDGSSSDLGMVGLDIDGEGNVLLTFQSTEPTCGDGELACIRKLAPDGTTLWTRPASSTGYLSLMPARFDGNGRAINAWAGGSGDVTVDIYDAEGALVESFVVLEGEQLTVSDLAIDPQGNLLVAGRLSEGVGTAWAARLSPTGDVLWSRIYDELGEADSLVGGVAISDDGRAYLVGASALGVPGFLQLEGSVWVAEIGL